MNYHILICFCILTSVLLPVQADSCASLQIEALLVQEQTTKDKIDHISRPMLGKEKYYAKRAVLYQELVDVYRQIIPLNHEPSSYEKALAAALYQIGIALLNQDSIQGGAARAANYFQEALTIRQLHLETGDFNRVKCYANLCLSFRRSFQFELAEKAVQNGLGEIENTDNSTSQNIQAKAYFFWNAAQLYNDKEDLYLALRFSQRSWDLFTHPRLGFSNHSLVHYGNQLGSIYSQLSDFEKGVRHLNLLVSLINFEATPTVTPTIFTNLGNLYLGEDSLTQALNYYQLALQFEKRVLVQSEIKGNQGIIYRRLGQLPLALESLRTAIRLCYSQPKSDKKTLVLVRNHDNLGDVFRDQGNFDSALFAYQKGINMMVPRFNDNNPEVNPSPQHVIAIDHKKEIITLLHSKAALFLRRYKRSQQKEELDHAREAYFLAIRLIDEYRASFFLAESKLKLLNDIYPIFEGAIQVSKFLGRKDLAFQLAEKAKATLLYQRLLEQDAKSFTNIPEELLNQERHIKTIIARCEHDLDQFSPEDPTYKALVKEISIQYGKLQSLIARYRTEYPSYHSMRYDTSFVDLTAIQHRIPEHTTLIEYFAGDSSWYIFAINQDSIIMKESKREVDSLLKFANILPRTKDWVEEEPLDEKAIYNSLGYRLYQQLIYPIKHVCDTNVIIIPDREMYSFPLEVLPTSSLDKEMRHSRHHLVLEEYAISYEFSVKLWQRGIDRQIKSTFFQKPLLAFAPSFKELPFDKLSEADKQFQQLDFFQQRQEPASLSLFHELTESEDEITFIHKIFGGKMYPHEGKPALLGRFIEEAPSYRLIHLATHGVFDTLNSRYSYLAFRPVKDGIDNERLYFADLYNLNLIAEMVVLSACVTQLGHWLPGEGVMSLAQAFQFAGAKSVVATLWSVNDDANSELMKHYYIQLAKGKNKAESLRLAKLELKKKFDYNYPFYWAAPIVIGDSSPIQVKKDEQSYLYVIVLIFASILASGMLAGWIMFRRGRKKAGKNSGHS
ncbi:MAG: CHAT domain-containing tetratricopeptide repeat protein [Bacteroidota bacterium]